MAAASLLAASGVLTADVVFAAAAANYAVVILQKFVDGVIATSRLHTLANRVK
jgi:hypothetical protein